SPSDTNCRSASAWRCASRRAASPPWSTAAARCSARAAASSPSRVTPSRRATSCSASRSRTESLERDFERDEAAVRHRAAQLRARRKAKCESGRVRAGGQVEPRTQLLVGHPFVDALDGDGGGDQRRRPAGHADWRGGQYAEGREHVPVARRAAREHDPGLFEGHLGAVTELVSAFPVLHQRRVADSCERLRKAIRAEVKAYQLLRAGGGRAHQQEKKNAQ